MSSVTPAQDYINRVGDIFGAEFIDGRLNLHLSADTVPEAKQLRKDFIQKQKQLRQLKREINIDIKTIRAIYKERVANAQPSTAAGILGIFGKRGTMRSSVAQKKRQLNAERDQILQPYDEAKRTIDDILLQLDKGKLAIDRYVLENK